MKCANTECDGYDEEKVDNCDVSDMYKAEECCEFKPLNKSNVEGLVIKAVLHWYRWQSAWAQLADGIIGVLTFGHIRISLALAAAKIEAKKRHGHGKPL